MSELLCSSPHLEAAASGPNYLEEGAAPPPHRLCWYGVCQSKACHLNAIALIHCECWNHACDLHLQAGAVDQLTGGYSALENHPCLDALVYCDCVHLALDLQ